MAERRMLTRKITENDAFTSLPPTTQLLYFHMCMAADDDGFCDTIRQAMFNAHAAVNDLEMLVNKRFIIPFENGVIVIKHWRMHNAIRKDRYHETAYVEQKKQLLLKDNNAYTENQRKEVVTTKWQPNGNQMATEDRLGKDSIGYINTRDSNESLCQTQTSDGDEKIIIEAWNALERVGISPVKKITKDSARYKNLHARLKAYSVEEVLDAIHNIPNSPWLLGQNNRGWTITFEWFVKPNNFTKVLEGQYLSKKSRLQKSEGDDDEWQEG